MGKEALGDMDDFPQGERPPTEDIVGIRTVRAPGVISDNDLAEALKSGPVRLLLDDLSEKGIHGILALRKRHEVTVFTSRNAKILALTAATLGAGAAVYALTRRQLRKKST